ncbi:hypothetical protein C7B61_05940, partial [filamentous cyanobacterium CCP1]
GSEYLREAMQPVAHKNLLAVSGFDQLNLHNIINLIFIQRIGFYAKFKQNLCKKPYDVYDFVNF